MGFAEELSASKTAKSEFTGTEQFNLPAGGAPIDPSAIPAAPEATETPAKAPEAPKFVLHGKEFTDAQEALSYAREQVAKAQGIQETLDKVNLAKTPEKTEEVISFEQEMETLMFTNPQEAVRRIVDKAKADATKEIKQAYNDEKQAETNKKQWTSFYKGIAEKNPDIADFIELTETIVTEKNWASIKDLPLEQAAEILADKTRDLLKIRKNATAKQTELPEGPATIPGATGGAPTSTPKATAEKALDFISQIQKHRKRS